MLSLLTATGLDWNKIPEPERLTYFRSIIAAVNNTPGPFRTIRSTKIDADELVEKTNAFYRTTDATKLGQLVTKTMGKIIHHKKLS